MLNFKSKTTECERLSNTGRQKTQLLRKVLSFLGLIASDRFKRRRLRVIILIITITLPAVAFSPVKTAGGAVVNTGLPIGQHISMDLGRVAFVNGSNLISSTVVIVYDTLSNSMTSFSRPSATSGAPAIYGDKVVIASLNSAGTGFGLYYCLLPRSSPLQPCGPWIQVVNSIGGGPPDLAFKGDIVTGPTSAAPTSTGFYYYRFSLNTLTTVTLPTPCQRICGLSTNGAIITFVDKPSATSTSQTLMYYDTLAQAPTVVDTGLSACETCRTTTGGTSIYQNIVAFSDNSTSQTRVGYYDFVRNHVTLGGPPGWLGLGDPAVWGSRIVFFTVCPSVPARCLGYWNINANPPWVLPFLAPEAAPMIASSTAIAVGDGIIAFAGSNGTFQFVQVPLRGDVNQDGKVDILDLAIGAFCYGQFLKNSTSC